MSSISQQVELKYSEIQQLISDQPTKILEIKESLQDLESLIQELDETDNIKSGYFRYLTAQTYLDNLSIEQDEVDKYSGWMEFYKEDYEEYVEIKKYENNADIINNNDVIYKLISKIKNLVEKTPSKVDEIQESLRTLENKIESIEYNDQTLFGYSKYLIADISLSQLQLSEEKQDQYLTDKNHYNQQYELLKEELLKHEIEQLKGQYDEIQVKINNLIAQQPKPIQQISLLITQLENSIQEIEKKDYKIYGYFTYYVAKLQLDLNLISSEKKEDLKNVMKLYKKEYIKQHEINIQDQQEQLEALLSKEQIDIQAIISRVQALEKKVAEFISLDMKLYQIYQYYVANAYLTHVSLSDEKKLFYKKQIDRFKQKETQQEKSISGLNSTLIKINLIQENITKLINAYQIDTKKLSSALDELDKEILELREKNFSSYAELKYFISQTSLEYLILDYKQKDIHIQIMKKFQDYASKQTRIDSPKSSNNNSTSDLLTLSTQMSFQKDGLQIDNLNQQKEQVHTEKNFETRYDFIEINVSDQIETRQGIKQEYMKPTQQYHQFQQYPSQQHQLKVIKFDNKTNIQEPIYQQNTTNIINSNSNLFNGNMERLNIQNDSFYNLQKDSVGSQNDLLSNRQNNNQLLSSESIQNSSNNFQFNSSKNNELELKLNNDIYIKNEINYELIKQRKYLLLGLTGQGKSSFVQYLTKNQDIRIGHGSNSETQVCQEYQFDNGVYFIDSPGIDDTKKSRYEILFEIVKYLHNNQNKFNNKNSLQNKYQPKDIFILLIQTDELMRIKLIQEFSYAYFLYETFENDFNPEQMSIFMNEYFQSNNLFNYQQILTQKRDSLYEKRIKIFQKKDIAFNYQQTFNNYHITIITHFDRKPREDLQEYNENKMSFLQEQVWSNKTENLKKFYQYEEYISKQKQHLFEKINKITEIQNKSANAIGNLEIQNIVLIGNSQVGKSSLIEQITMLSGLRGSGKQSYTNVCSSYIVEYKGILYRFIDTPGFEGTENNQTPFDCLKIISDYLRRNLINDFKILFMVKDIEKRDKMESILSQLFIFLDKMFNDDVTFQDTEYLMNLFMLNDQQPKNSKYELEFIRDKILKVERKYARSHEDEPYDPKEIYSNQNNIKTVRFQSNYFTPKQEKVTVDDKMNKLQIDTLFQALQEINHINIEEKLFVQIHRLHHIQVINKIEKYQEEYLKISTLQLKLKLIINLQNQKNLKDQQQNQLFDKPNFIQNDNIFQNENNKLIQQIQKQEKTLNLNLQKTEQNEEQKQIERLLDLESIKLMIQLDNVDQNKLTEMKLQILKQLDASQFLISIDLFNSSKIQKFNEQQALDYMNQNNILKYFIFLKYEPYLFEEQNTGKQLLISRKQLFYTQYSHQLKCFIQQRNEKYKSKVEELAMLKVTQDLALQQHLQKKVWEQHINEHTNQIILLIKGLIDGQSQVINSGIQIYKYATQFSFTLDLVKKIEPQLVGNSINYRAWARIYLEVASRGVDLYNFTKQDLPKYESSVSNLILRTNTALSLFLMKVASFFNKSVYDETSRLFIADFIEDSLPNQNLLYFQKAQYLLKKFQVKNYSQLLQISNSQFNLLAEDKTNQQKQNRILENIFAQIGNNNYYIKDRISAYITQLHISNKFNQDFEQMQNEKSEDYFYRVKNNYFENRKLIDTFYNRNQSYKLKRLEDSSDKLQFDNSKKVFSQQQSKNLNFYRKDLKEFIDEIQNESYGYREYINFGDGLLRRSNRFPIVFHSYCNLVQEKVEFKFQHTDPINEIVKIKNNDNFKLSIKNETQDSENQNVFQQRTKKIDKLELFCACEKFIANRYLNKIRGSELNISSVGQDEILNANVEFSLDLYQLIKVKKIKTFNEFEILIFKIVKQNFDPEQSLRLINFYNSIHVLEKEFGILA